MKAIGLLYGIISYAVGMGGLTFFILYVGGWSFMPVHVDSGVPGPLGYALMINISLMILWTLQHTVMARPWFKTIWTKLVPASAERSTYVLLSGVLMVFIPLNWQAMDGMLWDVDNSILSAALLGLHIAGWIIAVIATFLINHFELFGLQQVWLNFKNKPEPEPTFTEGFFYKLVRHPLQFGILMGLWFTPTMSMTLFCLSGLMTVYIFIGLYYEEIDLVNSMGDKYREYQKRVRKIIPIPK